MALTPLKYKYIGVNPAEEKPDVYVGNKYHHFTNKESGIARFLALVREQGENVLIAYESTGYISRRFATILFDHNIPQRCLNPAWVYYYGKSNGKYAKNDRIDSKTIFQYATEKAIQPDYPYNKFISELREKVAARKLLIRTRAKLKWQAMHTMGAVCKGLKMRHFH